MEIRYEEAGATTPAGELFKDYFSPEGAVYDRIKGAVLPTAVRSCVSGRWLIVVRELKRTDGKRLLAYAYAKGPDTEEGRQHALQLARDYDALIDAGGGVEDDGSKENVYGSD